MKNFETKTKLPHIGKIIKTLILEKIINKDKILESLNINESMLEDIYESSSLDFETLINFSKLLQTNLFLYYREHSIIKEIFDESMIEQAGVIEQKKETITHLTAIIAAQEKVIAIHEANETIQKWIK
ncbi:MULTISPECIES: hypothetical protein [Sphingobacterium]|jgi:hypothetical protein|uniref:hypothetical protein n=1 Tax=Sphingobacterium TaxID=28453 RepID=UPI000B48DB97|nr:MULTISPECIES: hypothetical protein [Sphingobacterium]